jgi:hypothetical protein
MKNTGNTIRQNGQSTDFIYSGLSGISSKGREYLKNIAQSLIIMQNRPGFPIPNKICQEIMQNPSADPFSGTKEG